MASGVGVDDDVIAKYQELKLGHKNKYIVMKMSDDNKNIVVEKIGGPGSSYEQFLADIPADDCRYAVFDFDFENERGPQNKLLFIHWAPESSKIKQKMLYTSSKLDLKKKLVGVQSEIQATDRGEIAYDTVLDKARKETRN